MRGPSKHLLRRAGGRAIAPIAVLAVALAASLSPSPLAADEASIAAAEAAYERGALREANRLFRAALRQPGHRPEQLVRIHVHLGILAGAMGAERTSRAHFEIALALEPSLTTPPELAGRDRVRFEQARPAHRLAVRVEPHDRAITVHVEHAPPGLVHAAAASCGDTPLPAVPLGRGLDLAAVTATLPEGGCPSAIVITLVDEHGNVLLRHEHTSRGAGP